MKTADVALTEWTCDDIKFDYQQGKGPQSHNRDQFTRLCIIFRAGSDGINSGTVTQANFVSGSTPPVMKRRDDLSDLSDWKSFSSIRSAIETFVLIMATKIQQDDLSRMLDQYFVPMNILNFETIQEVVTGLFKKAKL